MSVNPTDTEILKSLLKPGCGIVACEWTPVLGGNDADERNAKAVTTMPKISQFASGLMLPMELWQKMDAEPDGFVARINGQGMVPGLNLGGLKSGQSDRKIGQSELKMARDRQMRFVGAQVEISIPQGAETLAEFCLNAQRSRLIPVAGVRWEKKTGEDESGLQTFLNDLVNAFFKRKVVLERLLLQCGVLAVEGQTGSKEELINNVRATVRCFRRGVPAAVPAILLNADGNRATNGIIDELVKLGGQPWNFRFMLEIKANDGVAVEPAKAEMEIQKDFYRQLRIANAVITGKYEAGMETAPVSLKPSPTPL